ATARGGAAPGAARAAWARVRLWNGGLWPWPVGQQRGGGTDRTMSEQPANYPSPLEDADNKDFLEGGREGMPRLQHCPQCRRSIFYPRPVCPSCWSDELEWQTSSGKGEVVSYSRIYRPNHRAFDDEIPVVLAEIRLAEGATLLARI